MNETHRAIYRLDPESWGECAMEFPAGTSAVAVFQIAESFGAEYGWELRFIQSHPLTDAEWASL